MAGPGRSGRRERQRQLGPTPRPRGGAGRGGPGREHEQAWAAHGACCWSPTPPCTEGGTWATASSTSRASSGSKCRAGAPRPAAPRSAPAPSPFSLPRKVKRVLFVPYALHDRDAYARTAREKFASLGKAGLGAAPGGPEPFWGTPPRLCPRGRGVQLLEGDAEEATAKIVLQTLLTPSERRCLHRALSKDLSRLICCNNCLLSVTAQANLGPVPAVTTGTHFLGCHTAPYLAERLLLSNAHLGLLALNTCSEPSRANLSKPNVLTITKNRFNSQQWWHSPISPMSKLNSSSVPLCFELAGVCTELALLSKVLCLL